VLQCIRKSHMVSGGAVTAEEWFELRVAGSAGTRAGNTAAVNEGIAVGENGRLCSLSSGCARRFDSAQDALDYLGKIKVSGDYQFEPVRCGVKVAA
jgi:hypothetical protein